jgi:LuxR family transcriptional regulator, maltose regulon positive regulatory protein
LNDLASAREPLALVLDDYHTIENEIIHESLIFLIEHMPPTVRIVMTSRTDPPLPLARWRVRHQVNEIRAADLRFTPTKAAEFFNQVNHLNLSAQEIDAVEHRIEGWIAGLQLAALSIRGRQDRAQFITAFTGSNQYIVDYLLEEVLRRQSAEVQRFQLETSILERFSAALCNAVTLQNDAETRLAELERANLFLIPLDDTRQ